MKNTQWLSWEKTVGGLKFAVIIIAVFTVLMAVGTFIESYSGADFASRLIYKTWWFMLVQGLMFLSIVYAVYLRLPFKKNLYGFYVIHLGLILIGCGSFITWYAGVDGSIQLFPMTPTQEIILNRNFARISWPESGRVLDYKLPYAAGKREIGATKEGIELIRYYPFAETKTEWHKEQFDSSVADRHSSSYLIFNDNVSEEFILSLHPEALDFNSNITLGPLNVFYLPSAISECFKDDVPSGLIIWNSQNRECTTPEREKLEVQETKTGKRFLVVPEKGEFYSFFPEFSPFPLTKDFNLMKDSPLRVFSQKLFGEKPTLFLFGKSLAYKEDGKWVLREFNDDLVELPWMGFQVKLLKHADSKVPTRVPYPVWPIQNKGELIKGGLQALKVRVQGTEYWVTDQSRLRLLVGGKEVKLSIVKEKLKLPFELALEEFKMDKDPGTQNPASYESFVRLFDGEQVQKHHIFMNNPLKHDGLTFYQASYFPLENGTFGSVLSANIDPGRTLKYLGSLLLVIGSMWHFWIRRRKSGTPLKEQTA